MPKIKHLPAIVANSLKNVAQGDLRSIKISLQKYLIHTLDKHLKNDGVIRYSIWKRNYLNGCYKVHNFSKIRSPKIKFGIIYFCDEKLKKTVNDKILECLKKQSYNNYRFFRVNNNCDKLIFELDKQCSHICFIEQNDLIAKHALNKIAEIIQEDEGVEVIYSDEDVINRFGVRVSPYFKPQYAPLLLLSHNYMNALLCLKLTNQVIQEIKSLQRINQASIYQLVLKIMKKGASSRRIPDVLYHRYWKNALKLQNNSTKEIVQKEIKARQLKAKVLDYHQIKGFNSVKFYPQGNPRISIIIPFRDKISLLRTCIQSIETKSTYNNYEIILIDNGSEEIGTLHYLKNTKNRVIKANIDFNFSKLNNIGAQEAEGDYLILLNNDTKVVTPDWMESLLGLAQLPKVGAVGAKLIYPNNRIQHAGIVMISYHVNRFLRAQKGGYKQYNNLIREYGCVTGACIMVSKNKFDEIGGFTESLAVEYNDIDFCFKLLKAGYYNIYNPHCILYHYEAASRKKKFRNLIKNEYMYIMQNWNEFKEGDKFYNPNFSNERGHFCIKINK